MSKLRDFSFCQNTPVIECDSQKSPKLISVKPMKNDNGKRGWLFNRKKVRPFREIHEIQHNVPLEKCFEDKSEQCDENEITKYLQSDNRFFRYF